MRRRTPVAIAMLTGLAWMPAGGCSAPDREYDTGGANSSGGAVGQGGKAAGQGGKVGSGGAMPGTGGVIGEAGAGGSIVVPQGGAGGGLSEGGVGGGTIEGGAAGAIGTGGKVGTGGTVGSGGTAGAGGEGGSGPAACTTGAKMCSTSDVPSVCSATGVWVDQTACSRTVQNASAVCTGGNCDYTACTGTYQDCDTNRANGCESNKTSDSLNCGRCGANCATIAANTVGPVCGAGTCDYTSCATNFQDCDTNRANGCESNKNTDTANCGTCGRNCTAVIRNATVPACNGSGACDYTACTGTFQDCDGIRANGCESDKTVDMANCGGCGKNCTTLVKNASPTCGTAGCDYTGACTSGTIDCNGVRGDGCEHVLAASQAGFPAAFPQSGSYSPNYLLGHQITVPCSVLTAWGVVAKSAGTSAAQHLILALYKDSSGVPTGLVASSPVITVPTTATAPTTFTVPASSQIVLAAGTYWLMGVWDVSASPSQDLNGASQTIDYISFTYGGALPATFPTALSTYPGYRENYFLNLQ